MENQATYSDVSMKWHKFLVYFLLWAGVLSNVVGGAQNFMGTCTEWEYRMLPGLRAFEILSAVLSLVLAVMGGYTAVKLIQYSSRGPRALTGLYAAGIASQVILAFAACLFLGAELADVVDVSTITSLCTSFLMLRANKKYYENRSHLFEYD